MDPIDGSWQCLYEIAGPAPTNDGAKNASTDIALFIGAGLSQGSRLPSWSELTQEISASSADQVKALESSGIPLAAQLALARQRFVMSLTRDAENEAGVEKEWVDLVRDRLYRGFSKQLE